MVASAIFREVSSASESLVRNCSHCRPSSLVSRIGGWESVAPEIRILSQNIFEVFCQFSYRPSLCGRLSRRKRAAAKSAEPLGLPTRGFGPSWKKTNLKLEFKFEIENFVNLFLCSIFYQNLKS